VDGESCLWAIAGLLRLANNAKPNPLGVASGRSVDFRVSVAGPKAIGCREAVVLRCFSLWAPKAQEEEPVQPA